MTRNVLNETFVPMQADNTYRRQGRHIVIATIESLAPLQTTFEPAIWGGGSSVYTWGKVQKFFGRSPLARRRQMPMHFYTEYLEDDYVSYVGCPLTNTSWFLQQAVAARVLPVQYMDAVLVVLQENYGVEGIEFRLWRVLANNLLTPLMRQLDVPKERVVFFEQLADREAMLGPDWPFRFREPSFLDPLQLALQLKEYEKR